MTNIKVLGCIIYNTVDTGSLNNCFGYFLLEKIIHSFKTNQKGKLEKVFAFTEGPIKLFKNSEKSGQNNQSLNLQSLLILFL